MVVGEVGDCGTLQKLLDSVYIGPSGGRYNEIKVFNAPDVQQLLQIIFLVKGCKLAAQGPNAACRYIIFQNFEFILKI